MAVAVLNQPHSNEGKPQLRDLTLPQAILYGTLYLLVSAWVVYFGIPFVLTEYLGGLGMTPLYSNGLRMAIMAVAAVGLLIWGGRRMPEMPGLRSGIFLGATSVVVG